MSNTDDVAPCIKLKRSRTDKGVMNNVLSKYLLGFITIGIAAIFGLLNNSFLQVTNLLNILTSACVMGIAGVGITCIFAADELDFAAGTEVAAGACLMAWLLERPWCNNYVLALVITLAIMAGIGFFNAFINVKIGIPAFIATMGASYLIKGILKSLVGGSGIYASAAWPACFTVLGQGYIFHIIPIPAVILLLCGTFMLFYTEKTRSGKYIYAVGVNPKACSYLGIDIDKQKIKGFVLCSVLCGIGGIVQGSMLNGGIVTMGDSVFNNGLTALMLGAMFIKKGVFNVPGTLVGTLFIAIMNNGLTMVGAPAYIKDLTMGSILVVSVCIVTVMKLKSK